MVLRTVGPTTIGRYLSFATGGGIGEEEWPGQNADGAKGLEEVAQKIKVHEESEEEEDLDSAAAKLSSTTLSDDGAKIGDIPYQDSPSDRSTPTITQALRASDGGRRANEGFDASRLPHFYGFASNKIGEACMCWLTRWGVDLLNIESAVNQANEGIRIWSHRGLPATFLRAVLSADSFFVDNEMDRYRIARKVMDLRRKGWEEEMDGRGDLSSIQESLAESEEGWEEWEEDELELAKVFADGIYYTHMVSQL